MRSNKLLIRLVMISSIPFWLGNCTHSRGGFRPIRGFSPATNQQLERFLDSSRNQKGRKVAVFDGDGTVLGQTPHYLADECMYMYAKKHPERKSDKLAEMGKIRNVSIPYVRGRVEYLAGETVTFLREMGVKCFHQHYANKIFKPMHDLIGQLQGNGFEVWVVTGSPQVLYQQFLSSQLGIPLTHVVGVKSVVRKGVVTEEIVPPVPQDHGKKEAIETFIQEQPLFVAGNSRGDKEMIEFSRGLKMIVNPDEHVAPDQEQSIADYAKSENWLVVRIRDVPEPGFPSLSSREFGIRINKTHEAGTLQESP
jgi:phosphoserine phosphatase